MTTESPTDDSPDKVAEAKRQLQESAVDITVVELDDDDLLLKASGQVIHLDRFQAQTLQKELQSTLQGDVDWKVQSDQTSEPSELVEVGPYADKTHLSMNFECPECSMSIAEWTECPRCGWYDDSVWDRTLEDYSDCPECGQTTARDDLCEGCSSEEATTD